jgi:hypothetical protein
MCGKREVSLYRTTRSWKSKVWRRFLLVLEYISWNEVGILAEVKRRMNAE